MKNDTPLHLALLGYPVQHSLSPLLFSYFGRRAQRTIHYDLLSLDLPYKNGDEALTSTIDRAFEELHLNALNVTAPYKIRVGAFCQSHPLHPKPRETDAVNLVWREDGTRYATNTDFAGAAYLVKVANLHNCNISVLVLGGGGAVIPVLEALRKEGIATICCNRTNEKARKLAENYSARYLAYEALPRLNEEVILFSVLPPHVLPPLPVSMIKSVVDVTYIDSPLRQLAIQHSIPYVSGYAWLFAQAAEGYRIVSGDTTTALSYCPVERLTE